MDITKYKLNDIIQKQLVQKNGSIITKKKLFVVFPMRFEKIGHLNITDVVESIGIGLVLDEQGNGQILLRPNKITVKSSAIEYQTVNNKDYIILTVNPNDALLVYDELIVSADIIGALFTDFFIQSNNIPFFLRYEDVVNIFITAVEDGDKMAKKPTDMGVMLSLIAKGMDGKDYRFNPQSPPNVLKWYGLSDIAGAIETPVSLLSGGYIKTGLTKLVQSGDLEESDMEALYQ